MKKLIIILIFLVPTYMSGYAQELVKDSISIKLEKEDKNVFNNQLEYKQDQSIVEDNRVQNIEELEESDRLKRIASKFYVPPIQVYEGPIFEENSLGRILEYTRDYSFYSNPSLGNNFSVSTQSFQRSYIRLGANRTVSASLNYYPTSWLTISGGAYASKYHIDGAHYNDAGFTASLKVQLHERVYIRGHGLYSTHGAMQTGRGTASMGLYNPTYYGGGVGIKLNNHFGVEGGIVRQLDAFSGKWQNVPYVIPISYSVGRRK